MPYPIIETIGLEFETERIFPSSIHLPGHFNTTHDASIESPAHTRDNVSFVIMKDDLELGNRRRAGAIGTEIVSVPISLESGTGSLEKDLTELISALNTAGEPEKSYRAGIHIHVSMPISLTILKAIIRLGLYLESSFYYIGCFGYHFRGAVMNDSVYCRPITGTGPVVVNTPKGYGQIYDINDLLEATTCSQFWNCYGQLSSENGVERYHPSRYTWLNLHSLLLHSTLEFRVFNKTFNPLFILASIELCQKFCLFCLSNNYNNFKNLGLLKINSIFDTNQSTSLEALKKFTNIVEMEKDKVEILEMLVRIAPEIKLKEGYIFTHLSRFRDYLFWKNSDYCTPKISNSLVRPADYVDIHTIGGRE